MVGIKRKATGDPENLTGGTGDVNPQTYTIYQAISSATSNTQVETSTGFPLPVPRFPSTDGTAIVMELLEVNWRDHNYGLPVSATAAGIGVLEYDTVLTTNPTPPASLLLALEDPRTVSHFKTMYAGYGAAAALAPFLFIQAITESDREDTMQDGAGHGVLIATDNIYLYSWANNNNVNGAGFPIVGSAVATCVCVLNYRMKRVTLQEYVGIVQSQQ